MSVNQFKDNALVKIAGRAFLDTELSETSVNGLQNKIITAHINQINQDLSELIGKVGNGMRCIKYGTISVTSTITLDEEIDVDKYFVLINVNATWYNTSNSWTSYGQGAYLSAKTSTSFTIDLSAGLTASYQVIALG